MNRGGLIKIFPKILGEQISKGFTVFLNEFLLSRSLNNLGVRVSGGYLYCIYTYVRVV